MSGEENSKEIWVHEFTEKSAQKFRNQVMAMAEDDPNRLIPVYIDSYGGNADSLSKMIETMDEVDNRFITICSGKAISCGAILFSHGDVRYVGRLSRIMIHNVSGGSWGDIYSLKSRSSEAMRMNNVLNGLLATNCNMTMKELQDRIKNSTDSKEIWLNPAAAKKFGIADYIGTPRITPYIYWQVENIPVKPKLESEPEKKPKKKTTRTKKAAK